MDRSSTSLLVSVLWVAGVICAAPVTHTDAHRLDTANESIIFCIGVLLEFSTF